MQKCQSFYENMENIGKISAQISVRTKEANKSSQFSESGHYWKNCLNS